MLGYEGAKTIHYIASYMNSCASYKTMQWTTTIHPTLSEGLQSLASQVKIVGT